MLLNNDIQHYFCSNDFKLLKGNKCNLILGYTLGYFILN